MVELVHLPVHPELVASGFTYDKAHTELLSALDGQHPAPASREIAEAIFQLGALLLKKNLAYGDSALNPIMVFASPEIDAVARMGVRMDDKISRLARGNPDGEDPEMDLAGYLVLLRIAKSRQ